MNCVYFYNDYQKVYIMDTVLKMLHRADIGIYINQRISKYLLASLISTLYVAFSIIFRYPITYIGLKVSS